MIDPGINILLASYNGEKFMADQINSIINQTYTNWRLYIRDDGSSDNTLNIIKEYEQVDSRIHFIHDNLGNLGSSRNFSALMNAVKNENQYAMFSDQDDVWLPLKIDDSLKAILTLEQEYGKNVPLLVHTNFLFVDSDLKPIESKKEFQLTKIKDPTFSNVLCQNSVHGCTTIINQELHNIVGEIPAVAENHDYWIALVASAFGKIFYLNERTVLYRQHESNLSPKFDFNSFINRFKRIFIEKKNFDDVTSKLKMAIVFKEKYYHKLSDDNKTVIDDFISFLKSKSLPLLLRNVKHGIRRQTINQTLLFYITALLAKRNELHY